MMKIEPQHLANLEKLATFLESLPDNYSRFCMRVYRAAVRPAEHRQINVIPEAVPLGPFKASGHPDTWPEGVVACIGGHGPAAGILANDNESWGVYVERCFGAIGDPWLWERLFDSALTYNHRQAAEAIRGVLKEHEGAYRLFT